MGAATTTLMVVGGKIVKTIKTAQVRRQERAIRRQEKTQVDIINSLQEGSKKITQEYAGHRNKFDPNSIQAKNYPNGVEFDENGFARFEEYSVKSVKFEFPSEEGLINNRCLNGNYYHDEKLANAFIGYDSTPEGYVWHHVEDMQTMLLVPQDVHSSMMGGCSHTGGACYIKKYIVEEMKK